MFAYCNNNPVNSIDSTGASVTWIVGGLLGGAVAGACISAASYLVSSAIEGNSITNDGLVDAALCGAATGAAGAAIGMISIPSGAYICGVQITTETVKALGSITLGACVGMETNNFTGAVSAFFTFLGTLIPASGYGFWEDLFTNYAATLFTGTPAEVLAVGQNFYESEEYTNHSDSNVKTYSCAPTYGNNTVALMK